MVWMNLCVLMSVQCLWIKMSPYVTVAARETFLDVNSWGGGILCAWYSMYVYTACLFLLLKRQWLNWSGFEGQCKCQFEVMQLYLWCEHLSLNRGYWRKWFLLCVWSVLSISIEQKKRFKETNEQECICLAFVSQTPDGLPYLLTHNYLLFCLCGQLEARIWLNKRRVLALSEKWEETTCLLEHCCD